MELVVDNEEIEPLLGKEYEVYVVEYYMDNMRHNACVEARSWREARTIVKPHVKVIARRITPDCSPIYKL